MRIDIESFVLTFNKHFIIVITQGEITAERILSRNSAQLKIQLYGAVCFLIYHSVIMAMKR